MIAWLRRLFPPPDAMSASWLKAQDAKASRVEFDGVAIQWPIQKQKNESPLWNARKMKKRA